MANWDRQPFYKFVNNGDIELGRGNIISMIDIQNSPGDYPIYSSSAKGDGKMGEYGKFMFDEELITWSVDGGGHLFYRPKHKFSVTNVCGYIRVHSPNIDYRFLYYLLSYEHSLLTFDYQTKAHPSVIKGLYYFVPLPIEEQRAIADILSTVDEAIAQSEALVRKYQSIKQGLMSDLLTRGVDENGELRPTREEAPELYRETPLGWLPKEWEITEIENKLRRVIDYRGKTPHKASDGVPLITARNVRDGYLDPEPREYIFADEYDDWMNRGIPNEGDVMFTTEAPLGNVARVPDYKLAVGQRIITLQPKPDELDASYLFWLLLEPISKQRIQQKSTGSTAVGIKISVFVKVQFQFPKIEEQRLIGSILDRSQEVIEAEEVQVKKLKLLKQGLMQDLLSGRVRVKV
jgi:type I restriction enzyme S subunit